MSNINFPAAPTVTGPRNSNLPQTRLSARRINVSTIPKMLRLRQEYITELPILVSFFLMATQGLINAIVKNSFLQPWKQVLMSGVFLIAALWGIRRSPRILILAAAFTLVTLYAALINDITPKQWFYNIFTNIAWIPFFIFGRYSKIFQPQYYKLTYLLLIIVSAAGLATQMFTHKLDFLIADKLSDTLHSLCGGGPPTLLHIYRLNACYARCGGAFTSYLIRQADHHFSAEFALLA